MNCHWATSGRMKREDRDIVAIYAKMADIPKATGKRRVELEITLAPRQRAADPDAYWKSLLDALVKCGLLRQDSRKWCESMPPTYKRGTSKQTTIILTDLGEEGKKAA